MPKRYGYAFAETDQKVLEALDKAKEQREDLAELLDLSRELLQLRYEAKSRIPVGDEIWEPGTIEDRLEQGQPLLDFDRLPLDPASFEDLVRQVAATLIRHHPGLAEQEEALEGTDYIILAREWYEKGRGAAGASVVGRLPDLATLVVANALIPYLEKAAEAIMPHVDELRWLRPYCPVCGGQPDFAALERESGARRLFCSRCDTDWLYRRIGCPFCSNEDPGRLAYYPSEDNVYRLYVCEVCHRYLKAIDRRETTRPFHVTVERIVTLGMELGIVNGA